MNTPTARPRSGWMRQEGVWVLEILGLCGFAVAQPVLDVFGKSPETFVFRGAGPTEVVLFALVISLGPPLVLWVLSLLTRPLGEPVRRGAQVGILGVLASLIGIQVFKKTTSLLGLALLGLGLAMGVMVTLVLVRVAVARQWLRYAAVAPAVFIALFLSASPAAKLLRSPDLVEAAPATGVEDTPVVMVVFDEFPLLTLLDQDGGINRELFPNLAELARRGTWYRDYTTNAPGTHYAIPAMLTGRLPPEARREPIAIDYPNNLFALLRDSHRLAVFESLTDLCPRDLCPDPAADEGSTPAAAGTVGGGGNALAAGALPLVGAVDEPGTARVLGDLLGDAAGIWRDISLWGEVTRDITAQFAEEEAAEERDAAGPGDPDAAAPFPDAAEWPRERRPRTYFDFLRTIRITGEKPGLHFAHILLPHRPWRRYASGSRYGGPSPGEDELGPSRAPKRPGAERWWLALARQRHILQTQYLDRLIGHLLRRLEEAGLYEESLIVVTADHGLAIRSGAQPRKIQRASLHDIAWVPLFVKTPGQARGGPDDGNVMAIDVLPTIADVLGVQIPWEVDGHPASDPRIEGRRRKFIRGPHSLAGAPSKRLYAIEGRELERARRRLFEDAFRPADPSADARWWPYLVGPGAHLIGEAVEDLTLGPPSDRSATMTRPKRERLRRVELGAARIPGFVLGAIDGVQGPLDARVVVALNGRIGGVSEVFSRRDGDGLFSVVIPEFLFRQGRNDLELFMLEGSVLRPLPLG